jgi:hypothetical protein
MTCAMNGLGAYYAPVYEKPISGLGCGCAQKPVGAIIGTDANYPSPLKIAFAVALAGVVVWGAVKYL